MGVTQTPRREVTENAVLIDEAYLHMQQNERRQVLNTRNIENDGPPFVLKSYQIELLKVMKDQMKLLNAKDAIFEDAILNSNHKQKNDKTFKRHQNRERKEMNKRNLK